MIIKPLNILSGWCFCGNNFNLATTTVSNSNCNKPCIGDSTEMCGGLASNLGYISVFYTSISISFLVRS